MDLLDLMGAGEDLREKALERLEGIIALYASDNDEIQDEALARAISLCGKEWGDTGPASRNWPGVGRNKAFPMR
ncbi:MAG: hypothetical protein NVV74_19875 [Magnetospirillum sp.]|nr:hypothetical protein [Magnetospirillum sp.]